MTSNNWLIYSDHVINLNERLNTMKSVFRMIQAITLFIMAIPVIVLINPYIGLLMDLIGLAYFYLAVSE